MIRSAVIIIDRRHWHDWKRLLARRTLLERAVLTLGDAGIERIAILGGEGIKLALAGHATIPAVLHFDRLVSAAGVSQAIGITQDEPAICMTKPVVVDRAVVKGLVVPNSDAVKDDASAELFTASVRTLLAVANDQQPVSSSEMVEVGFTAQERRAAELRLLYAAKKPVEIDGIAAFYVCRPLSRYLTLSLLNTEVAPNHVSMLSLVLGVLSGPVAAYGSHSALLLSTMMLFAGTILDCVDGDLARVTQQRSRLGEWLDTLADDLSSVSFVAGLALGIAWWPLPFAPSTFGLSVAALSLASDAYMYSVLIREHRAIDVNQFPYFFLTPDKAPAGGVAKYLQYFARRDFVIMIFVGLAIFDLNWISLMLLGISLTGGALAVLLTAVDRFTRTKRATM
jgi:phosphatidylglycerophosphate synthase